MNNGENMENTNQYLTERNLLVRDFRRAEIQSPEGVFFSESKVWADAMQEKYADTYMSTVSYHAMIGSTPPDCTHDDFPGEDSALVFLQGMRDKYLKQTE